MAENIGVSVAGSIAGNKVADVFHLGGVDHIASIAGSIGANEAEQKWEQELKN